MSNPKEPPGEENLKKERFLKLKKSSDKVAEMYGAVPYVTITADKDCPKNVIDALIEVAEKIIKSRKK